MPKEYIPEVTEALKKVGLKWEDYKLVNNSCPPHPEDNFISGVAGAFKDINPAETKPQESPVQIGQGPKYSYMESDRSAGEKPAAVGQQADDKEQPLTQMAP